MFPKLKFRLALDIGTTSIGWCLIKINEDYQPQAIIKMGVRIFSDGRNPKDGSSLAVTRREARQMRRRRDRLLKRKDRLLKALIKHKFFPTDETERQACVNLDPYELRRKALYERIEGKEFARALFHINQRRGFKSNRIAWHSPVTARRKVYRSHFWSIRYAGAFKLLCKKPFDEYFQPFFDGF